MKTYVQRVVLTEQKKAGKISALIRIGIFTIMLFSFLALEKSFPWTALPIALLGCYALSGLIGLGLAVAGIYRPWFEFAYSTLDIFILFGFFAAIAELYHLPVYEILRLPGATLIFLFLALSAMRYKVSLIAYTLTLYAALWFFMVFAIGETPKTGETVRSVVLPLSAEFMRLAITALVALTVGILVYRTRQLLFSSIIERRRTANLSKYLPNTLVGNMANEGVGLIDETRCQNAAVLFVDIRGFTKMSENLPPKDIIRFLTEFRARMSSVIAANGGTIDKFIGDAIMVVFGIPEPAEKDARSALLCGFGMLNSLDDWNKERFEKGLEPVEVGIGIHFGEVIAGALGDETRVEYTVLGDTVNVAERLESLTRQQNTSLIVSGAVFKVALPFPNSSAFFASPHQFLTGRDAPVDTFMFMPKETEKAVNPSD